MNDRFSDEQIDKVLSKLMLDTAVDEAAIDEISTSPTTWWAVKRNIAQQSAAVAPWPPANAWRKIFSFGVPALAALTIAVVAVFWSSFNRTAAPEVVQNSPTTEVKPVVNTADSPSTQDIAMPETQIVKAADRVVKRSIPTPRIERTRGKSIETRSPTTTTERVATEFIALSHAGGPESGQVVRVKVPSSMMVSLGVVPSVAKPASLVDAEVVLGDDGQTHAIRFIR